MTKADQRKRSKRYYQAHKQERREYSRQYYQTHKEEARMYNQTHKEERKAYFKQRYQTRKLLMKCPYGGGELEEVSVSICLNCPSEGDCVL